MVNRCDYVELELSVAAGLEYSCINLDLLDAWTVKFLERCYNSCLFASARGSVYEEMGEVAASSLFRPVVSCVMLRHNIPFQTNQRAKAL